MDNVVIGLFSASGLLIFLYFGWENGPHHSSNKREIIYLLLVLTLLASGVGTLQSNGGLLNGHLCNTDGTYNNRIEVNIFEASLVIYFVIHVFLNSIPSAGEQLEGVPLTKEMEVSERKEELEQQKGT